MSTRVPQATTTARLPNLEVLRGVAALAILVGHSYALGGRGVPMSAEGAVDGLLMATAAGVWLFFALSGLVVTRPFVRHLLDPSTPRPDPWSYVVRRVARIYPLFLACALAMVLLAGTTGDGWRSFLAHLTLLHNLVPGHQLDFIGVTWTLSIEVLFYALVPVLAHVVHRGTRAPVTPRRLANLVVGTGLASVGWVVVGGALGATAPDLSLYLRMLLPAMWCAFCPGILIAVLEACTPEQARQSLVLRTLHRLRTETSLAWTVGGGSAALGFLSGYAQVEWGTSTYLWLFDLGRVAWSVAFGVLLVRAIDRHDIAARTPRPLVALGAWSYGVYLIHGTGLTILEEDGRLPSIATSPFLVRLAIVLACTLPLSWASWRLLEQPLMQASRRVRLPSLPSLRPAAPEIPPALLDDGGAVALQVAPPPAGGPAPTDGAPGPRRGEP